MVNKISKQESVYLLINYILSAYSDDVELISKTLNQKLNEQKIKITQHNGNR